MASKVNFQFGNNGLVVLGSKARFHKANCLVKDHACEVLFSNVSEHRGLFPESAAGIKALIPARLAYFESLGPNYGPLPASCGQ